MARATAGRGPAADRRLRLVLGAEVLLEAAARDPRLRVVVSDGAARPQDAAAVKDRSLAERIAGWASLQAVRGVSGTRLALR